MWTKTNVKMKETLFEDKGSNSWVFICRLAWSQQQPNNSIQYQRWNLNENTLLLGNVECHPADIISGVVLITTERWELAGPRDHEWTKLAHIHQRVAASPAVVVNMSILFNSFCWFYHPCVDLSWFIRIDRVKTLNKHFLSETENCCTGRKSMSEADYIFALLFSLKTIHDKFCRYVGYIEIWW